MSELNEDKLLSLAKSFRNAIDKADFSIEFVGDEGNNRMKSFPWGACGEATKLLGVYLTEKYHLESLFEVYAQIVEGKIWHGSHRWLEYNGIILDITPDQFGLVKDPVIVTSNSYFHSTFAKINCKTRYYYFLNDQPEWMIRIYQAIIKKL
ncbi:MAG: hypothetical protein HY960_01475 [Ignavibacteriae bacterium]|nr:hypothetical protein [Ignavibacteriota bacterium]